jgi:hypothetical protein
MNETFLDYPSGLYREWCKERMAGYWMPSQLRVLDEMPRYGGTEKFKCKNFTERTVHLQHCLHNTVMIN